MYIDPATSVTEENRGYNSNLYKILAQRTEGEAFEVVKNVAGQNEALSTIFRKDPRKTTTSHAKMSTSDEGEEAQRGHWHGGQMGDENIRRLEADFKEVFSNGLKSGIMVFWYSGRNDAQ